MLALSSTISAGFIHYFNDFQQRVHTLAEGLSNDQFWSKPHPYGNSFGNLVLHLTGNLSFYIGTQIEGTGYVRDREAEFAPVHNGSKADALSKLDEAVAIVVRSLEKQQDSDWSRSYSAPGVDDVPDRFNMYLRCSVHFHHHIGQMTYIVKAWAEAIRITESC